MAISTEQERATREDFEQWSISTNQGYDLTRNQSGRMQTYECVKAEHAWRGFFHSWQAARRAPVAQRVALTDEQIEAAFKAAGGRWADSSYWLIEDADLHPFVRGITQEQGC